MRIALVTIILSLSSMSFAASGFNSLEHLLQTEGVTSTFPSSSPLHISFSDATEVARAYCGLQNRKLMTYTTGSLDFPDRGEAWEYDSEAKIFIEKPFDYTAYTGAHTRIVLTSVTCGAQVVTCEGAQSAN